MDNTANLPFESTKAAAHRKALSNNAGLTVVNDRNRIVKHIRANGGCTLHADKCRLSQGE